MTVEVKTLFTCDYVTGCLENIDTQSILQMVLRKYHAKRNMSSDPSSIRAEDIRIDFNKDIQKLAQELCAIWKTHRDQDIELCWNTSIKEDPNTAAWAVVHSKGEMTNLHSHESSHNFESGAHISSAFWVQCPPGSGDFIFQYKPNPYIVKQEEISPTVGHFAIFDSTIPHFVTKNCTDELRVVISMNFKFVEL